MPNINKNNNNVIILVKLYRGIPTISQGQYPQDIGKYNVTAELDTDISTGIKYTVSTVNATLNIIPIQGDVIFGPNIFYRVLSYLFSLSILISIFGSP